MVSKTCSKQTTNKDDDHIFRRGVLITIYFPQLTFKNRIQVAHHSYTTWIHYLEWV